MNTVTNLHGTLLSSPEVRRRSPAYVSRSQVEPVGLRWVNQRAIGERIPSARGVTLIELMITIAVALILLGVAVPSFQNIIRTNRIVALTNELATALHLARSEAVTRGTRVTVCNSANAQTANPSCATGTNPAVWGNGWLVFVDADQDGTFDMGELLLRVGQPAINNATITTNDANFNSFIGFTATGASVGSVGSNGGQVSICLAPNLRQLDINIVGRLSISSGSCT